MELDLCCHKQQHIFFERGFNNRFNNLIIVVKLPSRQVKDSQRRI